MKCVTTVIDDYFQMSEFKINLANRTASIKLARHAEMIIFKFDVHAAFTNVTMISIFSSTTATNSTFVTVIYFLFFIIVVKEVAYLTKVCGKLNFTIFTLVRWFLLCLTFQTLDPLNFMPWQPMVFHRVYLWFEMHFIVTNPTLKDFLTLRALKCTFAVVMFAAVSRIWLK